MEIALSINLKISTAVLEVLPTMTFTAAAAVTC